MEEARCRLCERLAVEGRGCDLYGAFLSLQPQARPPSAVGTKSHEEIGSWCVGGIDGVCRFCRIFIGATNININLGLKRVGVNFSVVGV